MRRFWSHRHKFWNFNFRLNCILTPQYISLLIRDILLSFNTMTQKMEIKNKKYSADLRPENTKNEYIHLKYKTNIYTRHSQKKFRCDKIELFHIHISPIFLHNLRLSNNATISTLQRPRIIRSLSINTINLSA